MLQRGICTVFTVSAYKLDLGFLLPSSHLVPGLLCNTVPCRAHQGAGKKLAETPGRVKNVLKW